MSAGEGWDRLTPKLEVLGVVAALTLGLIVFTESFSLLLPAIAAFAAAAWTFHLDRGPTP